jgi:ubiquinone/menaquinone biosynthesis C-methylase UbiE/FtsZ-binding cell division protein ZapB
MDARRQNWTRHWATGAAHSCEGTYGATYAGAMGTFWQQIFAGLRSNDRILDIATGNGALPRLLVAQRADIPFHIDAVDLSSAMPPWFASHKGLPQHQMHFHTSTMAERLPLEDASCQGIVSQYGVEYAEHPTALQEMLRVLAPGGWVALVMHHADSRPVQLTSTELAHMAWLMQPDGWLQSTEAMLPLLAQATTPDGRAALAKNPLAEAARSRFNEAQDALMDRAMQGERMRDGADVLLDARQQSVATIEATLQGDVATAKRRWQGLLAGLQDAQWRLMELRQHALTQAQAQDWQKRLQAHVGRATLHVLQDQNHVMGWALHARPNT